jgi:hypothetical protein
MAFVADARGAFDWLLAQGFDVGHEASREVTYESSDRVFVKVFRDSNDFYVSFRVGLASAPADALTAAELAQLAGTREQRNAFPSTPAELRPALDEAAQMLRDLGREALAGEPMIFERARSLRAAHTTNYTQQRG